MKARDTLRGRGEATRLRKKQFGVASGKKYSLCQVGGEVGCKPGKDLVRLEF